MRFDAIAYDRDMTRRTTTSGTAGDFTNTSHVSDSPLNRAGSYGDSADTRFATYPGQQKSYDRTNSDKFINPLGDPSGHSSFGPSRSAVGFAMQNGEYTGQYPVQQAQYQQGWGPMPGMQQPAPQQPAPQQPAPQQPAPQQPAPQQPAPQQPETKLHFGAHGWDDGRSDKLWSDGRGWHTGRPGEPNQGTQNSAPQQPVPQNPAQEDWHNPSSVGYQTPQSQAQRFMYGYGAPQPKPPGYNYNAGTKPNVTYGDLRPLSAESMKRMVSVPPSTPQQVPTNPSGFQPMSKEVMDQRYGNLARQAAQDAASKPI